MRVAYLMNGLIGGLSGKNLEMNNLNCRENIIKFCAKTHKKLLTDDVIIDYFIFSWEPELEQCYVNEFNPVKIKSESLRKFKIADHFLPRIEIDDDRIQAHYGRWYGAQQVLNLMLDHQLTENIQYDLVVNARLDLCYHNEINFKNFETDKFHIANPINFSSFNWPNGKEFIDHIFIGSTNTMTVFLNLFNFIDAYTAPKQCPSYKLISSHHLAVWHLEKSNLLSREFIKQSLTVYANGYAKDVDYHIFRYEGLTESQLNQKLYE